LESGAETRWPMYQTLPDGVSTPAPGTALRVMQAISQSPDIADLLRHYAAIDCSN
jgi:hypothetical protein